MKNKKLKLDDVKSTIINNSLSGLWFSNKQSRKEIQDKVGLTNVTLNNYISNLVSEGFLVKSIYGRGAYDVNLSLGPID